MQISVFVSKTFRSFCNIVIPFRTDQFADFHIAVRQNETIGIRICFLDQLLKDRYCFFQILYSINRCHSETAAVTAVYIGCHAA